METNIIFEKLKRNHSLSLEDYIEVNNFLLELCEAIPKHNLNAEEIQENLWDIQDYLEKRIRAICNGSIPEGSDFYAFNDNDCEMTLCRLEGGEVITVEI